MDANLPIEPVEDGNEGISKTKIIMDKGAIGGASTLRDTPAEGLLGTGENLGEAALVLKAKRSEGAGSRKRPVSMMERKRQPISDFSWEVNLTGMTRAVKR